MSDDSRSQAENVAGRHERNLKQAEEIIESAGFTRDGVWYPCYRRDPNNPAQWIKTDEYEQAQRDGILPA
jgi:hypothetical protein